MSSPLHATLHSAELAGEWQASGVLGNRGLTSFMALTLASGTAALPWALDSGPTCLWPPCVGNGCSRVLAVGAARAGEGPEVAQVPGSACPACPAPACDWLAWATPALSAPPSSSFIAAECVPSHGIHVPLCQVLSLIGIRRFPAVWDAQGSAAIGMHDMHCIS